MKKVKAIGIMSGTSLDGLDGVLVEVTPKRAGVGVKILAHVHHPYPAGWSTKIRNIAERDLLRESHSFGIAWSMRAATLARALLKRTKTSPARVHVLGAHGQTVIHEPANGITVQLAELSRLAISTGIPVVGNFRTADIAAGGEGAPLVPHAHGILFGKPGKTVAVQNLGGIGNVTLLSGTSVRLAFDTGPGNCWIDTTVRWHSKGKLTFDRNGALARKGLPDFRLVKTICTHRYFEKSPPKSTGWEEFGESHMNKFKKRLLQLSLPDAAATATLATALVTSAAYRKFVFPNGRPSEIVVAGGGAKNTFLMEMLARLLPECRVVTSEKYGIGVDQLEAVAFALLAFQTMRGVPSNEPAATGAKRRVVLGQVAYPLP